MIEVIIRDHEDDREKVITGDTVVVIGIKDDPADEKGHNCNAAAIGTFRFSDAFGVGRGIGGLFDRFDNPGVAKLAFLKGFDPEVCERAERSPWLKVKQFFRRWTEC